MKYGRKTTSIARMKAAKEMSEGEGNTFADILPLIGMGGGAVAGVVTGNPALALKGASIGGQVGRGLGGILSGAEKKDAPRMGAGAIGLANLATDKKSADIIRKILGGPKVTNRIGVLGDSLYNRKVEDGKGIEWDLI